MLNILGIPFIGFQKGYSFNGPIWSVSVEIIGYIFFGLFLTSIQKNIYISFIILLISIILLSAPIDGISYVIRESLVFFWAGVSLFVLYQKFKILNKIIFGIAILMAYLAIQFNVVSKYNSIHNFQDNPILLTLLFGGIVFLTCASEELVPTFTHRFVSFTNWVGNLTYSTYLLHVPLQISFLMIIQSFLIPK
jgi:peptidoglycan/LPS O-acetylase OafA/YrhL